MKLNDFYKDLNYSYELRDDETINNFYHNQFDRYGLYEIQNTDNDMNLQFKGVDKILKFKNGRRLLIDEKKRRKFWSDIALEEYSDFDRKKVGWLGRNKITDYIVYWFTSNNIIYLLPFVLLQKAWLKNYHDWLRRYKRIFAQNNGYRTSSIPVKTEVLLEAIKNEMTKDIKCT